MNSIEPLRVALVTQGFTSAGGVQTVSRWLADGLMTHGHRVTVFDLANRWNDRLSQRLLAPSTWFGAAHLRARDGYIAVGAKWIEFEPARYRPRSSLTNLLDSHDIIQVVSGGPALAAVARDSRVPVVLQTATRVSWERASQHAATPHPLRTWRRMMTSLVSRTELAALKHVDDVMVENKVMMDFVVEVAPSSQVLLAPPGVDADRFHPHERGWTSERPILSLCRLDDPRKGLDRLIESYGRAVAKEPRLPPLVLAGRNNLPSHLRERISALGLDERVIVRSNVSAGELPALYRSASVFVQASHEEGLGISVLEAMASGLPVVSTRTAGSEVSIEDGVTGLLVDQNDDLIDAFAWALLAIRSKGLLMAVAARRRVEDRFSSDATLASFLNVYQALVDKETGTEGHSPLSTNT